MTIQEQQAWKQIARSNMSEFQVWRMVMTVATGYAIWLSRQKPEPTWREVDDMKMAMKSNARTAFIKY